MSELTKDISTALEDALRVGLNDEQTAAFKKKVRDLTIEIDNTIEYHFQDVLAPALVSFVEGMAARTVEAILAGNETEMRRYLGCQRGMWTGRSDSPQYGAPRAIENWHPVIHRQLFSTGALALREKIATAHRDLIASERVLDLEDQVRSLVAQVNKLTGENEKLQDRLRSAVE